MTTRKHEDESHKSTPKDDTPKVTPKATPDVEHKPTDDPMATPPWPVHGPNPVSEQT